MKSFACAPNKTSRDWSAQCPLWGSNRNVARGNLNVSTRAAPARKRTFRFRPHRAHPLPLGGRQQSAEPSYDALLVLVGGCPHRATAVGTAAAFSRQVRSQEPPVQA